MMIRNRLLIWLMLVSPLASAESVPTVTYLANEGAMFSDGDTKVLFDPLFNNGFGRFQLVPDGMRIAIFEGLPPFDGVDAVFVSHYHDDHFDPGDMLELLREQPAINLYAPEQAITAIREIATADDADIFDRINGLDLGEGDVPLVLETGSMTIEAAYIPHTGWPETHSSVQNIAYRVSLNDSGTVLHLGDADAHAVHFEQHPDYWRERRSDIALTPFWFFYSDEGRSILEDNIDVGNAVGIHVPAAYADPASVPEPLRDKDLFTEPGESRELKGETVLKAR